MGGVEAVIVPQAPRFWKTVPDPNDRYISTL